jgi:hypothetical protein
MPKQHFDFRPKLTFCLFVIMSLYDQKGPYDMIIYSKLVLRDRRVLRSTIVKEVKIKTQKHLRFNRITRKIGKNFFKYLVE